MTRYSVFAAFALLYDIVDKGNWPPESRGLVPGEGGAQCDFLD